jgi:hypothetical protein
MCHLYVSHGFFSQNIATRHKDFIFTSLAEATRLAFKLLRNLGDKERVCDEGRPAFSCFVWAGNIEILPVHQLTTLTIPYRSCVGMAKAAP